MIYVCGSLREFGVGGEDIFYLEQCREGSMEFWERAVLVQFGGQSFSEEKFGDVLFIKDLFGDVVSGG